MKSLKRTPTLSLFSFFLLIQVLGCSTVPQPTADLVWPLPPDEPRIKYIKSIASAGDVEKASLLDTVKRFVVGGDPEARLVKPYAVHADHEGRVFVVDTGWKKVLAFDFPNERFFILGVDGPGVLSGPSGVTTDSRGNIYVTDGLQRRAVVYNRDGGFLYAIGKTGQFEQPVAVAVNEALKRIYIIDRKKHNIQVFKMSEEPALPPDQARGAGAPVTNGVEPLEPLTEPPVKGARAPDEKGAGEFLFEFGKRGTEDGEFNVPTHLFIDREGKIYVTDTLNFRVQTFDLEGRFLSKFGAVGTAFGHFSKPKGIAVDGEGHIYVVDAAFNNVQIFDAEGRLLLFFGEFGYRSGQFWLPAGMDIDEQNRIYVADQYNHRINVYQYIHRPESASPTTSAPSPQGLEGRENNPFAEENLEGS